MNVRVNEHACMCNTVRACMSVCVCASVCKRRCSSPSPSKSLYLFLSLCLLSLAVLNVLLHVKLTSSVVADYSMSTVQRVMTVMAAHPSI